MAHPCANNTSYILRYAAAVGKFRLAMYLVSQLGEDHLH